MKKLLTVLTALLLVFTLSACKEDEGPSDADLVAEATTALLLTDIDALTADVSLTASGLHDSVITWSSSDTAFITDAGVVTRPAVGEEDAVVTLTATITIGDESDTKEFYARVIAAVPSLAVTIEELLSDDVESAEVVEVTATVIGIVVGAGVQISDGTGFVYVYNGGAVMFGEDDVVLGDMITVTGAKGNYYGAPQITDVTSILFVSAGNTVPEFAVTSIVDLLAEDAYDSLYHSAPVQVTGVVEMRNDGTNDNIFIVATDENNESYNVMIYYKSDAATMDLLEAEAGKMVTVDLLLYGYHSGYGAWRATINTTSVITAVELTDEQQAAYEVSVLDLGNIDEVLEDLVFNATSVLGSAVTWTTSDAAVVTDAGVVTRVIGSDTVVTLTASVTVGAVTETKEFVVTVIDADFAVEGITVAEALLAADDDVLVVEGVISGLNGSNTVIQDADGTAIVLYASGFIFDNNLELGDKIIIRGTRDTYYGLNELVDVTLLEVVSSDNVVFVHTDVTVAMIVADMAGYQGHNVVLTGLTIVDMDYDGKAGYIVVEDALANQLIFYAGNVPYAVANWAVDDVIDLSVIVYDVYYSGNRVIVYEYPALTDAEAVVFVSTDLYVTVATTVDLELPLMDDDFGVAIAWTSNNAAITDMGVVTQPAEGELDVVVTLTAVFTKGIETATVTYDVTVAAIVAAGGPTLFFSEYAEADGGNCKYVEIYNATDAIVDLSTYSIVKGGNGTLFADSSDIVVLTGTLAPGAVLVIGNSGCVDVADAAQDVTVSDPLFPTTGIDWLVSTVVGYVNGDDALGLFNNGVLIDVIGTNGTDPGSYWEVGDGDLLGGTTANVIMVRVPSVTYGETDWAVAAMQWIVQADDRNYSTVGTHTVD